jgi:hypothetical protein
MPANAGIHDFFAGMKAIRGCRPEPVLGRHYEPTRGPAQAGTRRAVGRFAGSTSLADA